MVKCMKESSPSKHEVINTASVFTQRQTMEHHLDRRGHMEITQDRCYISYVPDSKRIRCLCAMNKGEVNALSCQWFGPIPVGERALTESTMSAQSGTLGLCFPGPCSCTSAFPATCLRWWEVVYTI